MSDAVTNLQILPPVSTGKRAPGLRLALLAGILLCLAHPVPSIWPLAWIAIAPLILSVTEARSLRQAMWRGYLFGWLFLGAVWYWVAVTINAWTHNDIGWLCWGGLTLILAGFYGLWGGAAWLIHQKLRRIAHTGGIEIFVLACSWVVMEFMRTLGTLTMPWAQLSYSQYKILPVLQIAEITGAYGVSFVMMLVNGAVAYWWRHREEAVSLHYLKMAGAVTALVCLYGGVRLVQTETGRPLPVATMQAGFNSLQSHFNMSPPPSLEAQRATFMELTAQARRSPLKPVLYVWPESAAPGDALHKEKYDISHASVYDFLMDLARDNHIALITGSTLEEKLKDIPDQSNQNQTDQTNTGNSKPNYFGSEGEQKVAENASVLFDAEGHRPQYYVKRQLVPFGEFIPFRDIIPQVIFKSFGFPDRDDVTGKTAAVLSFNDAKYGRVELGPFICYEAMFPQYAREMTQKGATLLVTQSNDSWFQSRAAMEQHLASVVLRSIENRRQIVRSTTTGLTCFIDDRGHIYDALPINKPGFSVREMQMLTGWSLYSRFGDWFVLACCVAGLGLMWKYDRIKNDRIKTAASEQEKED